MIETYLLRGLAEIERSGSFTAAAKTLFVSQPALSRAMQKLEDELGVRFSDLDGETFVVFGDIGFWMPLCRAERTASLAVVFDALPEIS